MQLFWVDQVLTGAVLGVVTGMATDLSLDGLGKALEKDDEIRSDALENKRLLRWTSVKATGLINMQNMTLNSCVLLKVIKMWVPQLTVKLKTINLDQMKAEARAGSCNVVFKSFCCSLAPKKQLWPLSGCRFQGQAETPR